MRPYHPRYLTRRPFLVLELIYRPSKGARTERKGWQDQPNAIDVFEQPRMVERITPALLRRAALIIDVVEEKVIKNNFPVDEADKIRAHYLTKFIEMVIDARTTWEARGGRRLGSGVSGAVG